MRYVGISLYLCFAWVSLVQADTYYASPGGLTAGLRQLKPGDTLLIRGGTYHETIDGNTQPLPSGTAGSPVTIKAAGDAPVILQLPNGQGINLTPVEYLVLDGLIIDGADWSSSSFQGAAITLNGTRFVTIQNGEIRNFHHTKTFGIQTSHANSMDRSEANSTIRKMKIHDISTGISDQDNTIGHGIYGGFTNALVEDNQIYDVKGFGIQFYTSAGGVNGNTFRRNIVHDVGRGNGTTACVWIGSGNGNTAYNNILYNCNNYGFQVVGTNTRVYNNTIYNTQNEGIVLNAGASAADIRNNLLSRTAGVANLGESATLALNLTTADPGFLNAAAGDFHLSAGSPAIDAGALLMEVTTDLDQAPRPQGAGMDIGAFEVGGAQSPLPPVAGGLTPPKNFRRR